MVTVFVLSSSFEYKAEMEKYMFIVPSVKICIWFCLSFGKISDYFAVRIRIIGIRIQDSAVQ